jgi:ethanolamine utilization cobalamin adenosyltransferase
MRPDISFTVSIVSQFMHIPLDDIDSILRYLKNILGQEIWMKKNETNNVVDFSDAYWAASIDRKSITSFCTL